MAPRTSVKVLVLNLFVFSRLRKLTFSLRSSPVQPVRSKKVAYQLGVFGAVGCCGRLYARSSHLVRILHGRLDESALLCATGSAMGLSHQSMVQLR